VILNISLDSRTIHPHMKRESEKLVHCRSTLRTTSTSLVLTHGARVAVVATAAVERLPLSEHRIIITIQIII